MENRYRLILSNRDFYQEIELTSAMEEVRIGTDVDCDVRLRRELFFEPVSLTLRRDGETWSVFCADNFYLNTGDVRKLMARNLTHGDSFSLCYQNSGNEAFRAEFSIDFENVGRKYERAIDISSSAAVLIGAEQNNHIVLTGPYVQNDSLILRQRGGVLFPEIRSTTYGVFHNGKRMKDEAICDRDFFSLSDYSFYYRGGRLWTEIRGDMQICGLPCFEYPNPYHYPAFSRNVRLQTRLSQEEIEVLDPPARAEKPRANLLMRLLPSVGMLAASAVMAAMGGAMVIFSAVTGGISIVTAVLGVVQSKRDFRKSSRERVEKYESYIERKRREIEECRENERRNLEQIYPSMEEEKRRLTAFSPELFDRSPESEDFLDVRLGTGSVRALRGIKYKKQERLEVADDLQQLPEALAEEYAYVHNAPIVCPLKAAGAVGVTGAEPLRFAMLKDMVLDLCARQYHADFRLLFVAAPEHRGRIVWLRHLPNVENGVTGTRNIVCDDDSKNLIFEYLYKELTLREQSKRTAPHLLVFFYDEYSFKSHPVSKFVENAAKLGVTFLFFADRKDEIPQGCSYLISLQNASTGLLIDTADSEKSVIFRYPAVSDQEASGFAEMLAPVYTEEISLESSLTKNISLFELLHILTAEDLNLAERWMASRVDRSMAAPLGVAKSGVVSLDLHDKAHGPHGLVAGTTGSGKSELLQTYILSMSTLFHPYEVAFVIIDFKGGGMVNQFRSLPHLLGTITNIDGREIDRSLRSIKAELLKRQRLFAETEVNHIDKYIRKYRAGEASVPLPHLIIIVDEFAELKAEQPEFMKELISAARIGRSLGVHLILATQKPSGQVNEQIWSNSRFKLCLKVQSQEDSNEVLKSPLAAEIKEPGRAYLQVGNNEIFELFQSAYSGAPARTDPEDTKEFAIYSLTDWGKRTPVFVQKKKKNGEESLTQLDAVVRYVSEYTQRAHIRKLPDICLPPLRSVIEFPQKAQALPEYSTTALLGIYDDPDAQYQGNYAVDLSQNNGMIIGSAQSGKTNLLQTIIRSLASYYTPQEVNIYIIDFASMVLRNFEDLHHVGGVVTPAEDEKLKNLMKLLLGEIETRKEKLMSIGVSSFTAYREAGRTDLPQIVLLIDNLTALKELYFQEDDELLRLCREGLTVGISVIIANAQTAGIGYKYLSNFACRIALFCNDSGEYNALFDHCRARGEDIPGRGIVEVDKAHLDCQMFRAFAGEREIERVQEIRAFIAEINAKEGSAPARRIPVIPKILTPQLAAQLSVPKTKRFAVMLGLNYADVTPYTIDFANLGALAITGREGSGRHNFIRYAVQALRGGAPEQVRLFVVDGIEKRLNCLRPEAEEYSVVAQDAPRLLCSMEEELKLRYDALVAGEETLLERAPLLLLVLDGMDALTAAGADAKGLNAYKNIISKYRNLNVAILICGFENTNIPYSAPEIVKNLRDAKHFLFFDDVASMKIFDLPLAVQRAYKKPIEPGDCYYIRDNSFVKLKSVKCRER